MPHTADAIRTASNDRLTLEIIEPWLAALAAPEAFVAAPPPVRALVCVWRLHEQSAREGISSFVASTPTVVGDFVLDAADILELPWLAERWRRATADMDRAAQLGRPPSDVTWGDRLVAEQLEAELVSLHPIDVPKHVLRYLRTHADELVGAT